jgi:RNA polymerase sigma-70 factor, ECF subfamily
MSGEAGQLVRAVAAGDQRAMRALYGRFADELLRFAMASLGEREAAEDVVQETMVAAWAGARRFRGESSARSWLFGICRNQVALELRRRPRRPEPQEPDEDLAAPAPTEARAGLPEALELLDTEQRQLLQLVYVQGLPQQEVADALGIPLGTVKSRLFSARARLRDLMEGGEA